MFIVRIPPSCGSSAAASAPLSERGTGSARPSPAGGRGSTRGRRRRTGPPRAHVLKRSLDLRGAVELGEVDRLCHLAPHPLRARRGGLDQPCLGARADREERPLLGAAGRGLALERTSRPGRIVLDRRSPGGRGWSADDGRPPWDPGVRRRARRSAPTRRCEPTPARRSTCAEPSSARRRPRSATAS